MATAQQRLDSLIKLPYLVAIWNGTTVDKIEAVRDGKISVVNVSLPLQERIVMLSPPVSTQLERTRAPMCIHARCCLTSAQNNLIYHY